MQSQQCNQLHPLCLLIQHQRLVLIHNDYTYSLYQVSLSIDGYNCHIASIKEQLTKQYASSGVLSICSGGGIRTPDLQVLAVGCHY